MNTMAVAYGLAQAAPDLIRWIGGDDRPAALRAAEAAIALAREVTGAESGEAALAAVRADPALAVALQRAWMVHALALEREAGRRLAEINATLLADSAHADAYVRRWRPTFGYAVAISWTATMGAVAWVIVTQPAQAPTIIAALVNTAPIWTVALAVLGISVVKRSHDKGRRAKFP